MSVIAFQSAHQCFEFLENYFKIVILWFLKNVDITLNGVPNNNHKLLKHLILHLSNSRFEKLAP